MINEARQAAYFNLIESLLNCPNGEEAAILAANFELVDAGLVEMMREMAAQQEDENAANRLETLASQLAEGLNLTSEASLPLDEAGLAERLRFLKEVLQATSDSDANPEVIYPLLAANTDKIDDYFAAILRQWATATLAEVETEQATSIAADIVNFSNLIQQFRLGNKASNMEIAIAGYEVVATIFTQTAFPQDWAMTQNNLGAAYSNRIKGDKADNLEAAITAFTAALTIRTKTAFPQQWAMTQNNLGNAYSDRIKGDRADNLEAAITAFTAALTIRNPTAFPQQWAMTQNNLGAAYSNRIKGDKADNLEAAITAFTAALTIYTKTAFPQDWAMTQNNLGAAYSDRIKGDKADNLEAAITAFTAALTIRNPTAFPQQWAMTQNNLGNAYSDRIKGDRADNLEAAITAYTAALTIRTKTAFPQDWAMTQNNLGAAYSDRIKGDKADNLEAAITAYTAALTIRNPTAFPQQWAMTQNNLGNAYSDRIKGDKADNLELAITAFTAALTIRTKTAFPQNYVETTFNLGLAYQQQRDFNAAYQTFNAAINTVETLRGEIISGEDIKRKQSEEWNKLYLGMVEVCLELKQETEAIEYAERSKTRNLVELILERDFYTIFPRHVIPQLEKLRDEIAVGQNQIQTLKAENPQVLALHLQKLLQQRNTLQDEYLPVGYGFNLKQFQQTLDEQTAIIQWYITNTSIETFIITCNSQQRVNIANHNNNLYALIDWRNQYLDSYDENKNDWKDNLAARLTKLAEILHIEEVIKSVPKSCSRLILIPHRYLHLFPLHALPLADGEFLCDKFSQGVSYAPSCQLLQQVQKRERPNFESLFAVQNPAEDFVYTDLEVESILNLFRYHQVLAYKQATKNALLQKLPQLNEVNYLHFSCHGSFDLNFPQNSRLELAESRDENNKLDLNKCLTLGNLFERDFQLNNCRLVVLSACETGLIDFNNLSDEYIGLPSGFLYAGSQAVVSSLWFVDELSTAFLMIKFLENFQAALAINQDASVATALKEAQVWLRDATKEHLEVWASRLTLDDTWESEVSGYLNSLETGSKPFLSPFHWAAFTAVGK